MQDKRWRALHFECVGVRGAQRGVWSKLKQSGALVLANRLRSAGSAARLLIWQGKCSIGKRTAQPDCAEYRFLRREGNEEPDASFVEGRRRPGPGRVRLARGSHRFGRSPRDEGLGQRDQRCLYQRRTEPDEQLVVGQRSFPFESLEGRTSLQRTNWKLTARRSSQERVVGPDLRFQRTSHRQAKFAVARNVHPVRQPRQWSECNLYPQEPTHSKQAPANMAAWLRGKYR
jgi:hypothetical protein